MRTARRIAFLAAILSHAALAIGLAACSDRPPEVAVHVAAAAPPTPPPAPRITPPPPAEPPPEPTPEEKAEFARTGPK